MIGKAKKLVLVQLALFSLFVSIGLTVNLLQLLAGRLSPDDESSDVSSWGKLEKVESADVSDFNTWNVSQCFKKWDVVSFINNQWSSSGSISSVSKFSLAGSKFLRISASSNFIFTSEADESLKE